MNTLRLFVAALLVPIAFTAVVLADVAFNRRGVAGETVLFDQDVTLDMSRDEDSSARLWVSWSDAEASRGQWATCSQLEPIGFRCAAAPQSVNADRYYARQLPRYAFVAFALDDARSARSRLVPVDVNRRAAALASRYPDRRTHLITSAVVAVRRFAPAKAAPYVGAVLVTIDPRAIQVPTELRSAIPPRARTGASPPMRVTLRYGRRSEPWVAAIGSDESGRRR